MPNRLTIFLPTLEWELSSDWTSMRPVNMALGEV
jgi:hypothetical protein